ncbi:PHD and RING finger domain-containing protein 1-like [Trichoplusia ni]|uniref:PHD and RING finger domain-containing protein 1-like n=1 Tax=Trichoplusia ni TaxID=7111 RepID=A0A7E5W7U6_TRINI|nr:PHD and RING finger domain-containing protein 1-like [Trichoplusia ni]
MSEEGSEDSPPRPKRKIKKVMVLSSDTSSDSDESVAVAATRRKRLRVLSDEGSDSSGSSVVGAGARRRRALPKLRDSEADSDTSGWATDHSDAPKAVTSAAKPNSGFASDSSEGNSDKCSICLLRFTTQEVGTPQSCEHIFCLDCITEWSKNVNTCPVDRMTFDFIVVRACAGGRVLRTEPVKMLERRPSVELLVIEDPTICEVCGSTEHEETMLLCDGCDLGYHMQCLTPPLSEVPIDQWLCPNCDNLLSDVDYLFSGYTGVNMDVPLSSRSASIRESRSTRSSRSYSVVDEPSTSTGRRGSHQNSNDVPTTSSGLRTNSASTRTTSTRRKTSAHTNRRRPKRRRTKTVIIEYEVQEDGKIPVTKRVKRKFKKRRQAPRTAARRSHVRASGPAPAPLALQRQRAGIPSLSLFGSAQQLDYFSDDDERGGSESASTAVAARPTSSILSAYRQARRKMISVPSPPHASSAPDVLSSILESQTLLHSKKSIVSISVDGSVNIKLETREKTKIPMKESEELNRQEKLDMSKGEDAVKKVPSYPGQSRGGRGWGGGYTGNYHREQGTNNLNNRGGNYDNNYSGSNYQNRQSNAFQHNNNGRRDDVDTYNNYSRRPHQYPPGDDLNFDRNRRQSSEQNRPMNNQTHNNRHNEQGRYSLAPAWQPYVPPPVTHRNEPPPPQHRHSFGGFENPLDMRMGQLPRQNSASNNFETHSGIQSHQTHPPAKPQQQPYRPLPEPPMFKFDKAAEVENKSEDEKSDSGLVIDTEKYDPTEPTNDDDSGEDEGRAAAGSLAAELAPGIRPPGVLTARAAREPSVLTAREAREPGVLPARAAGEPGVLTALAAREPGVLTALAAREPGVLTALAAREPGVPPAVLDCAVRQVLAEHRDLLAPPPATSASDDDSEGDCPNFSIYSATSVHIANSAPDLPPEAPRVVHEDNLEDLVQEDDDVPEEPAVRTDITPAPVKYSTDTIQKKKSEEELKEKVSKRCPITTNPRNPIKIKLNTPSLIKRQVSLYDEEEQEEEDEAEVNEATEPEPEPKVEPESAPAPAPETSLVEAAADKLKPSQQEAQQTELLPEHGKALAEVSQDKKIESKGLNSTESGDVLSDDKAEKDDRENISTTPDIDEEPTTPTKKVAARVEDKLDNDEESTGSLERAATPPRHDRSANESQSDEDNDDLSGTEENELALGDHSPRKSCDDRNEDLLEKMTESISETEDERSYTPCLDENKSKDTSMETEKDKGIEGLDTEMISEDEGNEMFSDNERGEQSEPRSSRASHASPQKPPPNDGEEGEIVDKKKEARPDESKKKKKKDSKKEGKEKAKGKSKKSEVAFKKISKSGKERNYRDKDKKRERRDSSDGSRERQKQRRKERRKDLERYDVRTVVSEKRRRPKDAFGRDVSPRARSHSPSLSRSPARASPAREPERAARRRRREPRPEPRRRREPRKRRRSASASKSPRPKPAKRKKRARDEPERRRSPRKRSPRRRRARRRSASRSAGAEPAPEPAPGARSPASVDSRLLSPRTPPPEPSPPPSERRERRRRDPARHRRLRDAAGPSKEVFTSGDNILVSVSFKEQELAEDDDERRERRRERRRRRRRTAAPEPDAAAPRPVAIIDLERSPFRELTPSPRNVIVLSDSEPGEKETSSAAGGGPAPAPEPAHAVGPKTPPSPGAPAAARPASAPDASGADDTRGPNTPPEPPDSPDAYDPYEPTRSASGSPGSAAEPGVASPPRPMMTLETAQKTNMSADDVIDRRPLSPIEKVMALLQSTRDVSPEPPPGEAVAGGGGAPSPALAPAAPPVRIVLPSPTRSQPPKLFLAKPSPIKSDPIKPMQAAKIKPAPSTAAVAARRRDGPESEAEAESPYSPGSSDFGDLFEPPGARSGFDALLERPPRARKQRSAAAKVPVKLSKKKGKTQVGVKIDEDNLKILDDLPSSAVEMQVKSKFLKKLNRQERVVEEVKLVLKPHYNKKHVTKEEYKDILRRAVPKICHNKTGEINPAKIQSLVEAYVKKFRKKHKLGLV